MRCSATSSRSDLIAQSSAAATCRSSPRCFTASFSSRCEQGPYAQSASLPRGKVKALLAARRQWSHTLPMRAFWLTRAAKILLLLAFLVGMQPLALSTGTLPSTNFPQDSPMLFANDCTGCYMMGMGAGVCHVICTPTSAVETNVVVDITRPASHFSSPTDIAASGRVVRPSLAPPRLS
jgi:hypothetical protein